MNLFCGFSVLTLVLIIVVITWNRDHDDIFHDHAESDSQVMEELILLDRLDDENNR